METTVNQSKKVWHLLLLLSLFITQLDAGILSTNLSSIVRSFGLMPQEKSWVVAIYTMGLLFATPIMGSLLDKFGYRRIFQVELLFYLLGVLGIVYSQTFLQLMVARVVQAFGSSSILTLSISLVYTNSSIKASSKIGNVGALVACSTIVAPIMSVISLAKTHDWRKIYVFLAIVIAVILVLSLLFWKKEDTSERVADIDLKGNLLFVICLLALNLFLSRLFVTAYWQELLIYLVLLISSGTVFVRLEAHRELAGEPVLFSRSLWQLRSYRLALIGGVTTGLVMSLFAFFPSFMEQAFSLSVRRAGSLMTVMAIGTLIGSKLAGYWTGKKGAYSSTRGASLLVALSLLLLFGTQRSMGLFIMSLFVFGITIGMLMTVPLQVLIVEAAPENRNLSLSFLSVTKKLGMTIGIMLMGIFTRLTEGIGFAVMIGILCVIQLFFVVMMKSKE